MKSFRKSLVKSKDDDQEIPKRASDFDLKIPGQTFLWQADDRSPNSDKVCRFETPHSLSVLGYFTLMSL